jgi:ribosomal protein S10
MTTKQSCLWRDHLQTIPLPKRANRTRTQSTRRPIGNSQSPNNPQMKTHKRTAPKQNK